MESLIDIQGYEGLYAISPEGQVWSYPKVRKPTAAWLKPSPRTQDGYLRVCLRKDGKATEHLIHRLVYETFIGAIPEGLEVDHIDHNRLNNCRENLQIISHVENVKKMWSGPNKPCRKGESNGRALLTSEDVKVIRELYSAGDRIVDIADIYGVKRDHIWSICHRKTWKHV